MAQIYKVSGLKNPDIFLGHNSLLLCMCNEVIIPTTVLRTVVYFMADEPAAQQLKSWNFRVKKLKNEKWLDV